MWAYSEYVIRDYNVVIACVMGKFSSESFALSKFYSSCFLFTLACLNLYNDKFNSFSWKWSYAIIEPFHSIAFQTSIFALLWGIIDQYIMYSDDGRLESNLVRIINL